MTSEKVRKHHFVSWLYTEAERRMANAEKYRKATEGKAEGITLKPDVSVDVVREIIQTSEEDAARFTKWAELAADMIVCGFEQEVLSYYDARQAIAPHLLPPRPKSKESTSVWWTVEDVVEQLQKRLAKTCEKQERDQLQAVYITVNELSSIGKYVAALDYYRMAVRKYSELKLPEPTSFIDHE